MTLFPPLAALVALRKRLSGSKLPLVAWTFNVNALHGGVRGELARFALSAVDRFIVHSTAEVASYEAWLKLPPGRAQFVPLQQVLRDIEFAEETRSPFVLAMGSANRDYATFARAMAIAGVRGVVVAEPHALEGVTFPPNVEVRTGLSHQACNALVQEARVLVVPVASESTASGQVALLTGMMYGRPVIATRCAGTEDYVRDGDDGMLVPRGDADAMAECLLTLWRSQTQREAIGARARTRIAEAHSDQAIGAVLASVLAGIPGQEKPTEARKEQ